MTDIDASSIIEEFCSAAIEKGNFAPTPKLDRELHSKMAKAISKLYSLGEVGVSSLESMLQHESPYVRCWVAAELLAGGNEKSKPVLRTLANLEGLIATSAEVVMHEYEAGRLRSPFGTNVA